MNAIARHCWIGMITLLGFVQGGAGTLEMGPLFGDGMVLQRQKTIPIRGHAAPGEMVRVVIDGFSVSGKADAKGDWRLYLPPREAGGPFTMTVEAGGETLVLREVRFGEVWVCSGQSNMELPVKDCNPDLRRQAGMDLNVHVFKVPYHRGSSVPLGNFEAKAVWRAGLNHHINHLSAVAWFFGRKLSRELDVPIGLIYTYYGGTRAEVWTSSESIRAVPQLKKTNQWLDRCISEPKGHPNEPAELYNAMVAPLVPYAVRGVCWYQGEGNYQDGADYFWYLKALHDSWAKAFGDSSLPLYLVQLAPYNYGQNKDGFLPATMYAQACYAELVPNAHLVVINDLGDLNDIHPKNKIPVGERLAAAALRNQYGRMEFPDSARLVGSRIEKNRVVLSFSKPLKTVNGAAPDWFEFAGRDGVFRKCMAQINDNEIILPFSGDFYPHEVRFAWSQQAMPNLRCADNLPLGPFKITLSEVSGLR